MEKIKDFDTWLKNFVPEPVVFYAIYDNTTGAVTGVYPEHSCSDIKHKIKIDSDLAVSIFDGIVSITNCFVDLNSETFEVIQKESLRKIDDILHRIPEVEYSNIENPDVMITLKENDLSFSLSDSIKNKKIKWDGDTVLKFLVTEYNDPHKFHDVISFTLDDLYSQTQNFNYKGPLGKFSIFTNRILKTYAIKK